MCDLVVFAVLALHIITFLSTLVRYDGYAIAKSYLADDTFYYLHIANNIVDGLGSTFDGTSKTNGYHPLWLVVCCSIAAVFPRALQIEALYAAQGLLAMLAAWLMYRGLATVDRWAAAGAATLFLASGAIRFVLMNGMESALGVALLAALALNQLKHPQIGISFRTNKERWTLFLLLAGLSLTRLEMGLIADTYLACSFFLWGDPPNRRGVLLVLAGLAVVALAYLLGNVLIADWPIPISGSVKWGGAEAHEVYLRTLHFHLTCFTWPLLAVPSLQRVFIELPVAVLLLGALVIEARRRPKLRALALTLVLPCLAFAVIVAHRSGGFSWYGWPALFSGTISVFALLSIVFRFLRERFALQEGPLFRLVAAALVAYALVFSAHRIVKPRSSTLFDWSAPEILLDATIEAVRALPPDEQVSGSAVGLIAFMTERSIVQTEGLVNDREYLEAIRSGTTREVLKRRRVAWFVGMVHDRNRRFPELFNEEDVLARHFITERAGLPPLGTADDVMLVRLRVSGER